MTKGGKDWEETVALNLTQVNPKDPVHQEMLFLFCKEAVGTKALKEYHKRQKTLQVLTHEVIKDIVLSKQVVKSIVTQAKKIVPEAHNQEIEDLLKEIIKDEIGGNKPKQAIGKVSVMEK